MVSSFFKKLLNGNRFILINAVLLFAACAQQKQDPRVITLDPEEAVQQNREIEKQAPSSEVPEGIEVSLWASEQLLGDPVGLDIDNRGRAYVTVTNRSSSSEFDIRGHLGWIPSSMTWTAVEDRREFLRQEFAPEKSEQNSEILSDHNEDGTYDWRDLAVLQEEIYVIEDRSGDGVADRSHRFQKGFDTNEITDVLGTVYHDDQTGDVFAAAAPDVWRLRDEDGDGMADYRESISHGYAVHIGFSGHGMSGIMKGPDGKIYWGIGDIGANITDKSGKKWAYPNRGIIARANPDGSDFEVFAHGVRNTHEFEFDKYGNLISVDNDGDHQGESERIVHLIHGSDTGWRTNWQFGKYTDPKNNEYKVWMDEEYFKPRQVGQTAHILPPLALYHSGPSGMAYNPGTALSEEWNDHFFMSEFVGSNRSAIHAFTLEPKGASFELKETSVIQRGILGTSMDFGPDGALYVSDWIEGWGTNDKGRIWKIDTPGTAHSDIRQQTKRLLAEDFTTRPEEELFELLKHEDMRIRQKAQFGLAGRGEAGFETLMKATGQTGHQLARIHGIWGIGQFARKDLKYAEPLAGLLQDSDPEIRAQAAKVIGNEEYRAVAEELIPLLRDKYPRPRMYAAEALGKLKHRPALQPILDMLEANNDVDFYLRQAGAIALSRIGASGPVVALHDSPSRALRIAAVVALKRMGDPGVARFLSDEDKYIVTDAARAIGDDQFIEEALPALAALLDDLRFEYEPLTRRVINANLYVGTPEAAERVARYATEKSALVDMRVEATKVLGVWSNPSIFDRITGRHRGSIERDPSIVLPAVRPVIGQLLSDNSTIVKVAAVETASQLRLEETAPALVSLVKHDTAADVRIAALQALHDMEYEAIEKVVATALDDRNRKVRMTALELIPGLTIPEEERVELLAFVLGRKSTLEQQAALGSLGQMDNSKAHAILDEQMNKLMDGKLAPEIQLDLIQAVEASNSEALHARLERHENAKPDDPLAQYREALRGGDPERGRQIFYRHEAAQCTRCHAIGGNGADVGPPLSGISSQLNREQLLASLVDPGARIAPGYGTVSVTLENGQTISGVVQKENASTMVLQSTDGETFTVEKANLKSQEGTPSSMPPMGAILSKSEIRDLVEFLSTLE